MAKNGMGRYVKGYTTWESVQEASANSGWCVYDGYTVSILWPWHAWWKFASSSWWEWPVTCPSFISWAWQATGPDLFLCFIILVTPSQWILYHFNWVFTGCDTWCLWTLPGRVHRQILAVTGTKSFCFMPKYCLNRQVSGQITQKST
jgi:hypothetical protein